MGRLAGGQELNSAPGWQGGTQRTLNKEGGQLAVPGRLPEPGLEASLALESFELGASRSLPLLHKVSEGYLCDKHACKWIINGRPLERGKDVPGKEGKNEKEISGFCD